MGFIKPWADLLKCRAGCLAPSVCQSPLGRTNTILVSHGFNWRPISGFGPAEGEAVVYQPNAKGGFNLVARVPVAS